VDKDPVHIIGNRTASDKDHFECDLQYQKDKKEGSILFTETKAVLPCEQHVNRGDRDKPNIQNLKMPAVHLGDQILTVVKGKPVVTVIIQAVIFHSHLLSSPYNYLYHK
jgi:hypothetical protein